MGRVIPVKSKQNLNPKTHQMFIFFGFCIRCVDILKHMFHHTHIIIAISLNCATRNKRTEMGKKDRAECSHKASERYNTNLKRLRSSSIIHQILKYTMISPWPKIPHSPCAPKCHPIFQRELDSSTT